MDQLWANVTRALHPGAFEELEEKIYAAIKKSYLPTSNDFYYRDVNRTIRMVITDIERQIVQIEILMTAVLVPNRLKDKIDRRYAMLIDPSQMDLGAPAVTSELLDTRTNQVIVTATGGLVDDEKPRVECWLKDLPTNEEVRVRDRVRFQQCLLKDNLLLLRGVSYMDGFKVQVQNQSVDRLVIQSKALGNIDLRHEDGVEGSAVCSQTRAIRRWKGR